jgi:uncharacterized protein with HEPN domain
MNDMPIARDAITMNDMRLIRLAAAAQHATPTGKRSDILWLAILEARDRVVTDYRDVTPDEVWTKARTIAPQVIEALASR